VTCEICDRDPRKVNAHHHARGDGHGWCVGYRPYRPLLFALVMSMPTSWPKAFRIFTCGDEICVWRAQHHGVPGATYKQLEERAA